jgi:hypothetical protein
MALILEFASFLWGLVRTVEVFVINSLCLVIVIFAMLTLQTEISVFW